MPKLNTYPSRTLAAAVLTVAPAASLHAQGQPREAEPMVLIESAGLQNMLVSEKDAALRDAFSMLPAKIEELKLMIPEFQQVPDELSDSAMLMMTSPFRMAITNKGFDQDTGTPGVGMVMSWHMPDHDGKAHAEGMHQSVNMVMQMTGAPFQFERSDQHEMMNSFTVPFMFPLPVHFGPREAGDGWRYEILVGTMDSPDHAFRGLPKADAGMTPMLRGSVDLASFTPFVNMFAGMAAMAGPEVVAAIDQMRETGVIGEDAFSLEFVSGYQNDQSVSTFTMRGIGKERGAMLGMTDMVVSVGDLKAIPQDATVFSTRKMDIQGEWNRMREQIARFAPPEQLDEMLGMFRQMTGFDLETQIIPSLGSSTSFYMSDSTGGSSFMSSVMLLSLDDPETFHNFWQSVTGMANGMAAQQLDGEPFAFRFSHFEIDGTPFTQVHFSTLPIPFEPTFSVANGWLVAGLTPQACRAAVNQIKGSRTDITKNLAFAGALRSMPDVTTVSFVDSARTLRDGYPYVSMLGSSVANFMRPRTADAPHQPAMITPLYADLMGDVKPMISTAHWSGDDYVVRSTTDQSMLVNIAAILGVGDIGDIVSSMMVGGGIGAAIAHEQSQNSFRFEEEWEDDWEEDDHNDHDEDGHDEHGEMH